MSTLTINPPTELELVTKDSGLEAGTALELTNSFAPFFMQAREWQEKVATVTDAKVARASRLVLKGIRVEADKTRAALKIDSNRRGKVIEGLYDVVEQIVAPMEKTLLEVETAAERAETARKEKLAAEREELLRPYKINTAFFSLAEMPDEEFGRLLADTRTAFEAREAEAKRAEEERLRLEAQAAAERKAKEEADAAERERLRLQNIQLQKEADERNEAARVEAERVEKARKEAAARARREREKIEEDARIEQEKAEAIAKKERDRIAEIARVEREAREKLEREKKEADERERKRQEAEAAEAARLAAAPDKEKLAAFAGLVRTLEVPELSSRAGKACSSEIAAEIRALARMIEGKAGAL